MISSAWKWRPLRAILGRRPARRNEDLPAPGRTEDDEQSLVAGRAHAAQLVQALQYFRIAAKEYGSVLGIQRFQAPIRGARFVVLRRPGKETGAQARGLQPQPQPGESAGKERNIGGLFVMNEMDRLQPNPCR